MRRLNELGIVTIAAGTVLGVALLWLLAAPIAIFFGWVIGLAVAWICGGFLAGGLNTLFGTDRFTPENIPAITAALAFLASITGVLSLKNKGED